MSFLRRAADLSRPIKGPFSGSRAGNIDSFIRRLCAYKSSTVVNEGHRQQNLMQKLHTMQQLSWPVVSGTHSLGKTLKPKVHGSNAIQEHWHPKM